MGQQPSSAENPTGQPDSNHRIPTSTRVSRLSNLLSLRKGQGRQELEGDPNVTRFYELEGDVPRPEMVQNARSAGKPVFTPTYLHAEDLNLVRNEPGATASQRRDDATNGLPHDPSAMSTSQAGLEVTPYTQRTRRSIGRFSAALPNASLQATQWLRATTPSSEAASSRRHGSVRTAGATHVRSQALPSRSSPSARQARPNLGAVRQATTGAELSTVGRAQLSRQITSISHLLREMYSLDLKIFGTQNARAEDQIARNEMIDQAERLFERIRGALDQLADEQRESWTSEEQAMLLHIRQTAELHRPRRHELAGS